MRKILLFLCISLWSMALMAEDFKVGEAKYKVVENNGVELADFKKATGAVVIPEKVTNPKTGREYEVTAIGKNAFKQSQLTSVELPATVATIGKGAFKDCAQLTSVKLPDSLSEIPDQCFAKCPVLNRIDVNLQNLKDVKPRAFESSNISVAPIYKYLTDNGSQIVYSTFTTASPAPALIPVLIAPSAHLYLDEKEEREVKWIADQVEFLERENTYKAEKRKRILNKVPISGISTFVFQDPYASSQMFDLQKTLDWIRPGYDDGKKFSDLKFYFGGKTAPDGIKLDYGKRYNFRQAIEVAKVNKAHNEFLIKLENLVETAINDPANLQYCYRNIEPYEMVKFDSYFTKAIYALTDSLYLVKPELSEAEVNNLYGFATNCLMHMGHEYGIENMSIDKWAEVDFLNKDTNAEEHKKDYERILKISERILKYDHLGIVFQLVGLCGTGRWKEAAAYFPKVHRAVTQNGIYAVPYEITYMQKTIKEKGFNAATPTYGKSGKSGKSVGKKSSDSLIEFFVTEAIEAGVKHYEKKRAERKAREMFYKSIGLDKKGRLKK